MAANEQTIIDLETRFWDAIRDRQTEDAVALLAEKSVVAGPQGSAILDHDHYRKMANADATWTLESYVFDDVKVTFPADDVAVIAYQVTEDMTVEGEKVVLKAAETTTWVKQGEDWLAAAHTEAVLGDPFGRDRKGE